MALTIIQALPDLEVDPASLTQGMVLGGQTFVEFEVSNVGGADTGPVEISLPGGAEWLSVASPAAIANIAAGESVEVTLALTPQADLPIGLYSSVIQVDARTG